MAFHIFRVRREEFPLCPQVCGCWERGEGNYSLSVRVRRSEVFGLLQDVRARQPVAPDQTGASGHSQKHQSGRRKSITYCSSDRSWASEVVLKVLLWFKFYYGWSTTISKNTTNYNFHYRWICWLFSRFFYNFSKPTVTSSNSLFWPIWMIFLLSCSSACGRLQHLFLSCDRWQGTAFFSCCK